MIDEAAIVGLGVAGLAGAYTDGTLSAREATLAYLARIARHDPQLNAFITVTADEALQQAEQSDARRARGGALGPLDGAPIALKDNIDLAGAPTTAGLAWRGQEAALADAAVVARLRAAGAVFLGKLNMDEAALGAATRNPHHGWCRNPYRLSHSPGGSSGGSAAATAAGLCAAALGSDTLGSVRLPAAFCGVVGLKPSYGLLSTRGVRPLSWRLDHLGFLTRSVGDLRPLLDVAAGFDPDWPWSRRSAPPPDSGGAYLAELSIGFVDTSAVAGLDPAVLGAVARAGAALLRLGAAVGPLQLEGYDFAGMRKAAVRVMQAEAAVEYAAELAEAYALSAALRNSLEAGARRTAQTLAQAHRALDQVGMTARRAFSQVSVLLLPTTLREAIASDAGLDSEGDLTAFANIAGLPAISLPCGVGADGLPLGVQLIAPPGGESLLLCVAQALEAALPAPFLPAALG